MKNALKCRSSASTKRNDSSSRSHAVNIITVKNTCVSEAEEGILYLVDLAGSERNADQGNHDKQRIKETKLINTSLMNLKDCIRNRALYMCEDKY